MDAQELATRLTWTVFEFFVIRSQVASFEKYEYECLHFTKDEDEANEVFLNISIHKKTQLRVMKFGTKRVIRFGLMASV